MNLDEIKKTIDFIENQEKAIEKIIAEMKASSKPKVNEIFNIIHEIIGFKKTDDDRYGNYKIPKILKDIYQTHKYVFHNNLRVYVDYYSLHSDDDRISLSYDDGFVNFYRQSDDPDDGYCEDTFSIDINIPFKLLEIELSEASKIITSYYEYYLKFGPPNLLNVKELDEKINNEIDEDKVYLLLKKRRYASLCNKYDLHKFDMYISDEVD